MIGMYYKQGTTFHLDMRGLTLHRLRRIALKYLVPIKGLFWKTSMGEDPDKHQGAVKIVFSRVEKPYKTTISLEESLDAGVRMIPLVVATVLPSAKQTFGVIVPQPQNNWGPHVVMPYL